MTKERPSPSPSSDGISLSSVADFLLVIDSKDISFIVRGMTPLPQRRMRALLPMV